MTFLVGGVGELYQGDLDIGRVAVERLTREPLPPDVLVEELHYGAVAVAQHLEELGTEALVLIGAARRGRAPGTVERRRIGRLDLDPAEVQEAVTHAVTGYIDMDLVVTVASGLGVLPARTVVFEIEPAHMGPCDQLSDTAQAALRDALELVRLELERLPLLGLADTLRARLDEAPLEPSPALETMRALLAELEILDGEGRWAGTFAERDRLRLRISLGETGEGMDHLDWGLWWTLIEELDRLQRAEAEAAL